MAESAVAELCENLRDLRRVASEHGQPAALEALVVAERVGSDVELALSDLLLRLGVPGSVTPNSSPARASRPGRPSGVCRSRSAVDVRCP